MNLILVGKSGSGKSTAAEYLKSKGMREIISHTTRARREGEGESYIFSTKEEFEDTLSNHRVFEHTEFGGNIYWTTFRDFLKSEGWFIIVDPVGVHNLQHAFSSKVVYITSPDHMRKERVDPERYCRDIGRFVSFPCDYVVENDSSIENLQLRLDEALQYLGINPNS